MNRDFLSLKKLLGGEGKTKRLRSKGLFQVFWAKKNHGNTVKRVNTQGL
jgi:hypothetical protein